MVIRELLLELSERLAENPEFEAREIVMCVCSMNGTELALNRDKIISDEAVRRARELAERRLSHEPLQYITGIAGFMGMDFEVNPHTLIPRQDTETLVEAVIERAKAGARIIDIGTGSGCIGISLAKYIKNADVSLVDISAGALETAGRNAVKNNVNVSLIRLDILNELPNGKFDIIVSNPPYIRTDVIVGLDKVVRDYEPVTALDGGTDGLMFYRRITAAARKLLNEGGILAFEIGYDQGESVRRIAEAEFENVRLIKDLCGNDRVIIADKLKR